MRKNKVIKLLVLSSSLILASCGGKSSSTTSSESKEENSSAVSVSSANSISTSVSTSEATSSISSISSTQPSSSKTSVASSTSKEDSKEVEAISEAQNFETTKNTIQATELFRIESGVQYTLSSSNEQAIAVATNKTSFSIIHAGSAVLSIKTSNNKEASVTVTVLDDVRVFAGLKVTLDKIKTGYNIQGYSFEGAAFTEIYQTINPNYTYDNKKEVGYGIFKDGNVYKFKSTPTGDFVGVGSAISVGSIWKSNLFKTFEVKNTYIALIGNKFNIPYYEIGTGRPNALGQAIIEQVGLSKTLRFEYVELSVGSQGELNVKVATSIRNGEPVYIGEYILADFGIAGIDDVENFLKVAEIPAVSESNVENLKTVFNKYIHSTSYRMFGCDIVDSDREVFYNYYSPTQYYEYFMGDASGYINLEGKVYNYTADQNNHVVLGGEVTGKTDYKEIVETAYTTNLSMFDKVVYNATQECFIYVPTAQDNALAKYLLHTLGYDLNGKDAFLNEIDEIAFLIEGDIIYCDINLNGSFANGQIKFQFDQLNSVNMPEYKKPTSNEGAEHAGRYVGKGTKNVERGKYEDVTSELNLNTDLTGNFTFGEDTYEFTWTASDDPTNQNKVNFLISITSEVQRGESFVEVYKYKSSPDVMQVKFSYDSKIVHISWNAYRLQK